MPLVVAEHWAEKILEWIAPYVERAEVAGSIRRRRAWCADVDLVVIPKVDPVKDLIGTVVERRNRLVFFLLDYVEHSAGKAEWVSGKAADGAQFIVNLPKCQLDLWMADETTWTTRFVCRTGSKEFNIWLAQRALTLQMHWAPYEGIKDQGRVLAVKDETDFFSRLKLPFIAPEKRERKA